MEQLILEVLRELGVYEKIAERITDDELVEMFLHDFGGLILKLAEG